MADAAGQKDVEAYDPDLVRFLFIDEFYSSVLSRAKEIPPMITVPFINPNEF